MCGLCIGPGCVRVCVAHCVGGHSAHGGGLHVSSLSIKVLISSSTFQNNSATVSGMSAAGARGGGAYLRALTNKLSLVSFQGNAAMVQSRTTNAATSAGGGLWSSTVTALSIRNSGFFDNKATAVASGTSMLGEFKNEELPFDWMHCQIVSLGDFMSFLL